MDSIHMKLRWANPHTRQDDRECGVLLYMPGSWQQINLQIKHQIYQSKHLELDTPRSGPQRQLFQHDTLDNNNAS